MNSPSFKLISAVLWFAIDASTLAHKSWQRAKLELYSAKSSSRLAQHEIYVGAMDDSYETDTSQHQLADDRLSYIVTQHVLNTVSVIQSDV